MGADTTVHGLFATLKSSLESATEAVPTSDILAPPADGISLLDVKNELLLSYLHNLVFLILLKARHQKEPASESGRSSLDDQVVRQLVELRVYLEKGTRPLEGRLKYQIDKVLRAADDVSRRESGAEHRTPARRTKSRPNKAQGSDEESSNEAVDPGSGSEDVDELSYRPNPAAMLRTSSSSTSFKPSASRQASTNGTYKPPRIAATSMPTPTSRSRDERRPQRSTAVDDYINTELATAPYAEPSIGSTIVSGGRRTKSDRERAEEAERRQYEETNFMRLPAESKAEKARKRRRDRGSAFGEEEFGGGFGAGLDRIERLTQRKGGRSSRLETSRMRAVEDGPRNDGMKAGDMFAKRRKMDSRKNRR